MASRVVEPCAATFGGPLLHSQELDQHWAEKLGPASTSTTTSGASADAAPLPASSEAREQRLLRTAELECVRHGLQL